MYRLRVSTKGFDKASTALSVKGVDGFLVAEWTGRFVPAVRDAGDYPRLDGLVDLFEAVAKDAALVE